MNSFNLSCSYLFDEHSLCYFRKKNQKDSYDLNVLMIGYGSRFEVLLKELMTYGQLLDTKLNITLLTKDGKKYLQTLEKKFPYISHFCELKVDGENIYPFPEQNLATIDLYTSNMDSCEVRKFLNENKQYTYSLISTGKDEINRNIVSAFEGYKPDNKMLVAFVQNKFVSFDSKFFKVILCPFGYENKKESVQQIERIAKNLQYVYLKNNNEHISNTEVEQTFLNPYDYSSNMHAALHIKSKLLSCGIKTKDMNVAAKKFDEMMKKNPSIVNRLAAVEHNRWVLEKIFQGYSQVENLSQIYQNGNDTHSVDEKWHCCLLPCDMTGQSKLTKQDWKQSSHKIRENLDPLDKMTLAIHNECKLRYEMNYPQIESLLDILEKSIQADCRFTKKTVDKFYDFKKAIVLTSQFKKTSLRLYSHEKQLLEEYIVNEDSKMSSILHILNVIHNEIKPLLEYVSYKDYKYQDILFIQKIPFVLTNKFKTVLAKSFSNKEIDNVYMASQLNPSKMIYFCYINNKYEFNKMYLKMKNTVSFIKSYLTEIYVEFYIFTSLDMKGKVEKLVNEENFYIYGLEKQDLKTISDAVKTALMSESKIDYLDITNGNPILNRALESTLKKETGIFYVENGKVQNIHHAEELEYDAVIRKISVSEMFSMYGTELNACESDSTLDLSLKYKDLWEFAIKHQNNWDDFCKFIISLYNNVKGKEYKIYIEESNNKNSEHVEFSVDHNKKDAIVHILNAFAQKNCVNNLQIQKEFENSFIFQFDLNTNIKDFGVFKNSFNQILLSKFDTYTVKFGHDKNAGGYVEIQPFSLKASGKAKDDTFKNMLEELQEKHFIRNFNWNSGNPGFEIASVEVLKCFQKSGTILECYIYYSALFDGNFDDVEMGYSFKYNPNSMIENEIDVICTKNNTSLFISAKMRKEKNLKSDNYLNYSIYEILLLSEHFGINSKTVLVAPSLSQFNEARTGLSETVMRSLERGVYVVGRECCQKNYLGKVLSKIAEGCDDWCSFILDDLSNQVQHPV